MREDIWVDELNFKSYQNNEIDFIDDSGKSCCVHSLADYTKQVRKEVCEEIKKFAYDTFKEFGYFDETDLEHILDQIQGETKNAETK